MFDFSALDLCSWHSKCVATSHFASQPAGSESARPLCDGRSFRFLTVSPPGESRPLFSRFPSVVAFFNFAIYLALTLHDLVPCDKGKALCVVTSVPSYGLANVNPC